MESEKRYRFEDTKIAHMHITNVYRSAKNSKLYAIGIEDMDILISQIKFIKKSLQQRKETDISKNQISLDL